MRRRSWSTRRWRRRDPGGCAWGVGALELSHDCTDAYVLLATAARDPRAARAHYEQGVRAAERALGPVAFRDDVGHFQGILETRTYIRARQGLAGVLWHLGQREAAIGHLQDMLRLNPDDNQGLRYALAGWLLATGDDAALAGLLDRIPTSGAPTGPTRAPSRPSVSTALATNPFVPACVGFSDENEAVAYIAEAVEGWLATVVARDAPPPSPAKPRRLRRT